MPTSNTSKKHKTTYLHKGLILVSMLISFSLSFVSYADNAETTFTAPNNKVVATLGMVRQLSKQHYSKLAIDDELSSHLLDDFIDSLDPAKVFFLEKEIQSFNQYRLTLDDQLKTGNVRSAYAIYNTFHKRAVSRLERQLSGLESHILALDFDKKEYLIRDNEDAKWAKNTKELDDRWRKRLKNDVLALKLADKTPEDISKLLKKRLETQLRRIKEVNNDDVYTRYMNAYAALYDPHTSYFLPKQRENFDINMSRSLEGIGAVLSRNDEFTKVVRLVTAGPAAKQGELKPSDHIVGVGQGIDKEIENVVGWRLDEVVDLIRGPKNSIVRLQVSNKKERNSGKTRIITIKRGKVELEDMLAKSEVLDIFHEGAMRKVGIITIPDFYADMNAHSKGGKNYRSVTRDVAKLLIALQKQDIEGLVIDLRNNGGGSLSEANMMTSLFIGTGPTVLIRDANQRIHPEGFKSRALYDGPLVVMINRLSASASEIFAGAIQDYGRGLIVGSTSFGKGTVQTLLPLAEGSIKLTTAKFYRVSGVSTQYRGVIPDISFPSQFDPEDVGESALDNALEWDRIKAMRHRQFDDITMFLNQTKALHQQRIEDNPDFVFFKDEFTLSSEQKKDNLIPLNIKERKAKQEQAEEQYLALENKRRKAKGLELIESLDDLDEEDEIDASETEAEEETEELVTKDDEPSYYDDVFAMEAANILIDSIRLSQKKLAAAQ